MAQRRTLITGEVSCPPELIGEVEVLKGNVAKWTSFSRKSGNTMATKFFIYCSKHSLEAGMLHGGIEDKGGDCLQTVTLELSKDQEFNVSFFVARLNLQTFTYALLKI